MSIRKLVLKCTYSIIQFYKMLVNCFNYDYRHTSIDRQMLSNIENGRQELNKLLGYKTFF